MSTTYPNHAGSRFVEVRPSSCTSLVWLVVAESGKAAGCHAGALLTPAEAARISRALYSSAQQVHSASHRAETLDIVAEALPYSGAGRDEAEHVIDRLAEAGWRLVKDGD